jgi:hypothetical protein
MAAVKVYCWKYPPTPLPGGVGGMSQCLLGGKFDKRKEENGEIAENKRKRGKI